MYMFLFSTVIVNSLLTLRWPSTAETCRHRRTNKLRYLDSCVVTDLPTLILLLWAEVLHVDGRKDMTKLVVVFAILRTGLKYS